MCPACGRIIASCSLSEQPHYGRSSLPAFFQGRSCPRLPGRRTGAGKTGSRPVDPPPCRARQPSHPCLGWPLARPFQLGQLGLWGEVMAVGSSAESPCCQPCPEHVERTHAPGHSQTRPLHPCLTGATRPGSQALLSPSPASRAQAGLATTPS